MKLLGKTVDAEYGYKLYDDGMKFLDSINLFDTVKVNENMFIGKQWEGVVSNGLPTPQMNFLKRVTNFVIASITTDNLSVPAQLLPSVPNKKEFQIPLNVLNAELESLMELRNVTKLVRYLARDAAVRGSGCVYTYWDEKSETGQGAKGNIKSEIIKNTRVFFGDANNSDVQSQPYIIIAQDVLEYEAKRKAKANGNKDWESIRTDTENKGIDDAKRMTNDKVRVLNLFWRDEESEEIWCFQFVKGTWIRKPWSLGIKRYPVIWFNWDNIDECYQGQAMLTGIIPNQVFVNKIWAMTMLSMMKNAFPTKVYDSTRIKKLDNRVGAAIAVQGGDVTNAIKVVDPAPVSPQVYQYIDAAISQTQENLGASAVALGDTRPDNTSAIVALQRASATPSELTKLSLYDSVEELFRIYAEFVVNYYGTRTISRKSTDEEREAMQFANMPVESEVTVDYDFGKIRELPYYIRIDVGASAYYNEIANTSTLTNLLQLGMITLDEFLERIPDGQIKDRMGLAESYKRRMAAQQQMQMGQPPQNPGGEIVDNQQEMEIPETSGNSALQRAITEGAK